MSERKGRPSLSPQRINDGAWYYENPRSIDVYVQPAQGVNAVKVRIPASKLRRSLKRMASPESSRGAGTE
jgi:hypothetical protein